MFVVRLKLCGIKIFIFLDFLFTEVNVYVSGRIVTVANEDSECPQMILFEKEHNRLGVSRKRYPLFFYYIDVGETPKMTMIVTRDAVVKIYREKK